MLSQPNINHIGYDTLPDKPTLTPLPYENVCIRPDTTCLHKGFNQRSLTSLNHPIKGIFILEEAHTSGAILITGIETNQNPVTWICSVCQNNINQKHTLVLYISCSEWSHLSNCSQLTNCNLWNNYFSAYYRQPS